MLSLDELLQCGLSRETVRRRVANGRLHPMHRGVYAVGHAAVPLEGRFLAAVKACGPDAVLSHFSAATLLGLVKWDERHAEVTVRGPGTRRHAGVRVHRTHFLEPRDVIRREGMQLTSPARTLLDLAATFEYRALRRAARQAQSLKLVGVRQLAELLTRTGRGAARATWRGSSRPVRPRRAASWRISCSISSSGPA